MHEFGIKWFPYESTLMGVVIVSPRVTERGEVNQQKKDAEQWLKCRQCQARACPSRHLSQKFPPDPP
jgi:hypothetical protein